jgi:glycosyltransferase involved in cell wall biosynthesis
LRCSWPISKLTLTINELANPAPSISWVRCVGELNQCDMLKLYQDSDALVFLSKEESFGFPLVEAMYLGLPIICSDLPFARALCGDGAIYFNPDDITSLNAAILDLKNLLIGGWRPNWHKQMRSMPKTWQETADNMIKLCV